MVDGEETSACNMRTRHASTSEPCLTQSSKNTIIASLTNGGRDQCKAFIKLHSFMIMMDIFSKRKR